MLNWTIYHNPKCSKSRQALELLRRKGFEPSVIEYLKTPPTVKEMERLISIVNLSPEEFLRKKEKEFAAYSHCDISSKKVVAQIISECPKLLERPIVICDNHGVIARPPEKVRELFG